MSGTTASPTGPRVTATTRDGVAWVTLDSPHNRNALSDQLVTELVAALTAAEADDAVRVVVLGHTGNTFCAGADLSEASSAPGGDPARERADQLIDVLALIAGLDKPVVGRIEGHVRAGGMGLVAACDLVVAGPRSTYALTESRLGLAAAVISVTVLPRLTSRAAGELFLTGDTVGPERAQEIGLVTRAAADDGEVESVLAGWLGSFAVCSPQGLRESKQLLNHHLVAGLEADRDRVAAQSSRLFSSEEAREGMKAFLERRPPRWVASTPE